MTSAAEGRDRGLALPTTLLVAATLVALTPALAAAQSVRGSLVTRETGSPVSGAIMTLLDAGGAERDVTLSQPGGGFVLNAPGEGRYRIRVERIGFRTWTSDPLRLEAGQEVSRRLEIPVRPVPMSELRVSTTRECVTDLEEGEAIDRAWKEARKALRATSWTETAGRYRFTINDRERLLHPETLQPMRRTRSLSRAELARKPYGSLRPAELLEKGFVQEEEGTTVYFAPDATVLLSDAFRDTHCFRLRSREGGGEAVVLEIEPVPGRTLPDIAGELRLDPETAALERLEFRYTGLPGTVDSEHLGGEVRFERLPDGAWIVREWRIRLPVTATRHLQWVPGMRGVTGDRKRTILAAIKEVGGEITGVHDRRGDRVRLGDAGAIVGTVHDSTRRRPLEGAVVTAMGTGLSTVTDQEGRFRLEDVPPGSHEIYFGHPRVRLFGMPAPGVRVEIEGTEERELRLATPGPRKVLEEGPCPGAALIVAGWVLDIETGRPVSNAEVEARWSERSLQADASEAEVVTTGRRAGTRSRSDGSYRLCLRRLPRSAADVGPVEIRASHPEWGRGTAHLSEMDESVLVREDLGLQPGEEPRDR